MSYEMPDEILNGMPDGMSGEMPETLDNPFEISLEQNMGKITEAHDLVLYDGNYKGAYEIYIKLAKEALTEELRKIYEGTARPILEESKKNKTTGKNPFKKDNELLVKKCDLTSSNNKCPRKRKGITDGCTDCPNFRLKVNNDSNRIPKQRLPGEHLPGGAG